MLMMHYDVIIVVTSELNTFPYIYLCDKSATSHVAGFNSKKYIAMDIAQTDISISPSSFRYRM